MTQSPRSLLMRLATLIMAAILVSGTAALAQDATTPVADEPGFETFGALPWEEPPGAVPYLVWEVVDGDTITVIELNEADALDPWWEPVRMIGVDAPEKDGPYTDEECYGQEASEFLAEVLPRGTTVYLQVDNADDIPDNEELTNDGMELDDHDRWLVHVYLRAGETDDYYLVTEILALGGYVDVKDYEGNTYFVDDLFEAEEIARELDRGMWGACDL